jgi:hypothetical protein
MVSPIGVNIHALLSPNLVCRPAARTHKTSARRTDGSIDH